MSELPVIDSLKVAKRESEKLRALYNDALHREAQLEVLAEALRDERDVAVSERDKAQQQLAVRLVEKSVDNDLGVFTDVEVE